MNIPDNKRPVNPRKKKVDELTEEELNELVDEELGVTGRKHLDAEQLRDSITKKAVIILVVFLLGVWIIKFSACWRTPTIDSPSNPEGGGGSSATQTPPKDRPPGR